VLGGAQIALGVRPFRTEQIGQRDGTGTVATCGERATSLQRGKGGDGDLVDSATRTLTEGQNREQISVPGTRTSGHPQRIDRLRDQAIRNVERALRHTLILPERMFENMVFQSASTAARGQSWC
jgi:hypothetical protein